MDRIQEAMKRLGEHNLDENLAFYLYNYLPKDKNYEQAIDELIKGKPIQYIIGNVDFYGNILEVNPSVLIPRFETELLVEKTISYIKKHFNKPVDILDIGTGSGCIAITLKKQLPESNIKAVDISEEALEVARENAFHNNVEINYQKSNLLNEVEEKYDVIISNPPYISYEEEIMDIVKNNEPHLALYAKNNGLECYEKILQNVNKNLKENYLIAFEIGMTQAEEIVNIANKNLKNIHIHVEKDYNNRDRFIFIHNKAEKKEVD